MNEKNQQIDIGVAFIALSSGIVAIKFSAIAGIFLFIVFYLLIKNKVNYKHAITSFLLVIAIGYLSQIYHSIFLTLYLLVFFIKGSFFKNEDEIE